LADWLHSSGCNILARYFAVVEVREKPRGEAEGETEGESGEETDDSIAGRRSRVGNSRSGNQIRGYISPSLYGYIARCPMACGGLTILWNDVFDDSNPVVLSS
jgi:hypothetical protein